MNRSDIIINGTDLNDIKVYGVYSYTLNIDIDSLPTITLPNGLLKSEITGEYTMKSICFNNILKLERVLNNRYLIRITDKNDKVCTHDLGFLTEERAMCEYQNYVKSYPECECSLFMKGGYKSNE